MGSRGDVRGGGRGDCGGVRGRTAMIVCGWWLLLIVCATVPERLTSRRESRAQTKASHRGEAPRRSERRSDRGKYACAHERQFLDVRRRHAPVPSHTSRAHTHPFRNAARSTSAIRAIALTWHTPVVVGDGVGCVNETSGSAPVACLDYLATRVQRQLVVWGSRMDARRPELQRLLSLRISVYHTYTQLVVRNEARTYRTCVRARIRC